jgi:Protein of unknown function (DUF1207)
MPAPARSIALAIAALIAANAPARAQGPLPPSAPIEMLPPAQTAIVGPPLDYFDLDSWLASDEASPLVPRIDWHWQLLPDGIIYRAYLAAPKETRLGTQIFHAQGDAALWDSTVGGRVGLLRFGTPDPAWPQGWQFDVEASAQVRLDPDENIDLRSVDYRIGSPLTYGYGRHRLQLGYYHLCSHLGDEFVGAHPAFSHVNFVRDAITLGYGYFLTENLRLYGELGYGFRTDISQEWELQFGFDYAPARPTGIRGAPFFAAHGHLREELNYSGNLSLQAGWAWRGSRSSHLLRTGLHYYNGLSNQYSFYQNFEQQIGGGLWYDF